LDSSWANTVPIERPIVDYVGELKRTDGGDIGVHGSIEVSRTLVAAGLVDVIHLVVAPTLAGGGKRLFSDLPAASRVCLDHLEADPHGNLFLTYRRRDDEPQ
jgi:dihydrofolate reductase